MFGNEIELKSEKDFFVNMNEEVKIKSSLFATDDDFYYDSFLPREDRSSYLIKKLNDGRYTIFEDFDINKAFNVKYDKITPIKGGLVANGSCYALKIENNNESFFVSPIDLTQTKLDNEVQSIIMTSFISDAYKVFTNAVSDLQFSDFVSSKFGFNYKEGLINKDKPYKINKITNPPLSNNIDFSHYDSKTCELLAGRFYTLVENFKETVKTNPDLSKENKKRLLEEFFPVWEEKTLRKLYEISQISKGKDNISTRKNDSQLVDKVKKATISVKKEMSKEDEEEIRELLTENTIDNGGTLEYATLMRDLYVVIESEGEILGYLGLVDNVGYGFYIGVIAVKKEYQGLGVGSKMYDFIKKHSKQFNNIKADVRSFNINSKRLHIKQGFQIVDRFGEMINPNELVYLPSGNIEFNFDLKQIKNRKPLEIGTKMKLSDVEKQNISENFEMQR